MSTFAEWRAKNKKEEEQTVPQSESSASTFKEWRKSHNKDGGNPITQGQLGDVTTAMREQAQRDYLRSKYVDQAAQKSAIEQYHSQYNDVYQQWRKQNIREAGAPARDARMQKTYGAGYDQQKFDAVEAANADADKYYNAYVAAMENGGVDPTTGMSDVDAAAAWQNAHKNSYDGWDANTRAAYDRYQYAQIPKSADFRDYTGNRPVNPTREQTADRIVGEGDDRTLIKGQAIADPVGLYLNANDADKYDAMSMGTETGGLDAYGSVMQRGQNEAWDLLRQPKYNNLLDTYYYLLNKEGMDSAMKYMDSIAITLQRDAAQSATEQYQKDVQEANALEKIALSASTLAAQTIGGGIGFVDNMIRTVQGKETNPYSAAHSLSNYSQTVRSEVSNEIDKATGFIDEQGRRTNKKGLFGGNFTWGSLYQSVMSTGDMLINAPLGGKAYGLLMGMGASESAAKELYEKGASNGQIFWGSIMSGAIEMLTEKYSMESLINIGDSKTIMAALWNTAKQGFTEGSEEFFSEIGNAIFDLFNMKDKSDIMEMFNENGQDVGKTIVQLLQQAGDAFLGGFFSGALSGSAKSFFGTERTENGQRRATGYLPYVQQFNAEGAAIRSSTSGVQSLYDMNAEMNSDSTYKDSEKARKAAEAETKRKVEQAYRNRGKLRGITELRANVTTGRMLDSISEGYAKASSNEIAAKLTNAGMKKSEVDKIAPAIAARINGTSMTNLQQEALEDALNSRNMAVRRVISEIITDSESQTIKGSERLDDYVKAVRSNITLKAQAAFTGTEEQKREKAKEAIGNDMKVSEDGKTIDNATGAEVSLDAKPIVMNDGKLELKLTNGSTVSASDLSFGSDNESLIFGALAKTGMNTDDANAVYQYLSSINEADLPSHAAAVVEAYRFGAHGISTDNKALLGFSSVLPDTVRTLANNAGKTQYGSQQYKARQFRKGTGTVRYDGLNEQEVKRNANAQQRTAIRIAEFLAAAGFDIEIFESKVDEKGNRVGENGKYVDGKIRIDLYAGGSGEGMMAYTIAHEATHQIEEMSPAEFHAYADSLFAALGEKGIDVNSKVIATLERVRGMKEYKGKSEDQLWNIAYSEVVAEATETMLTDTNAIEKLSQRISMTDKTLWGKIKNVFSSIANRLREAYRNMKPDSDIARAARSVITNNENLVDLWVKAAQNAMENFTEESTKAFTDMGVTAETADRLAADGMTVRDGVIMSEELAKEIPTGSLMTPNELEMFQPRTEPDWEKSYLERFGDNENTRNIIAAVRGMTDALIMDDIAMRFVPNGEYTPSRMGPLRTNTGGYIWSFDMDTSCPRTFQFNKYRDRLQRMAGRPLTYKESVNLLELLRAYGQQIPCSYCYVENKRVLLNASYNNWFNFRSNVINAKTDAEAMKQMYGYNAKKNELPQAAAKVFAEWRSGGKKAPSVMECWTYTNTARNSVFNFLDANASGNMPTSKLESMVRDRFGINSKGAVAEIQNWLTDWKYETLAGIEHSYITMNDEQIHDIDEEMLAINHEALAYAKSASSAKSVDNYTPYIDQLKNVTEEDKAYIIGMGGIRKHSSNDFRIDYVHDYLLFYADLAAGGWTGHTYTKDIDFVKIFANTKDRINVSIAFYGGGGMGAVRENIDEGAPWADVKKVRAAYKNVGAMAMVTNDDQLSYAMNADWIDMIIPFHASSLDKAVWKNLRAWFDYTSKQNEKFLNSTAMKTRLKADGIAFPKGAKAAQIAEIYNAQYGIKMVYDAQGNRQKPHFMPNDTYTSGGDLIPGHHNDHQRYLQLCEEYGVSPRFKGVKVKDANGKTIDVTEHPGYIKLIKETARSDSEQEKIEFNFDKHDDFLGMTPWEYAMQRLDDFASINGYENTGDDQYGIVKEFAREYLGKNRDIGYLTDRAKAVMGDVSNAYREMNTVTVEGQDDSASVNVDYTNGDVVLHSSRIMDQDKLDSLNAEIERGDYVTVYRSFQIIDGGLYAPMNAVDRDENGKNKRLGYRSELGQWEMATESPEIAQRYMDNHPGSKWAKFDLDGVDNKTGGVAYNPYLHSSNLVLNDQFSAAYRRNLVTVECRVPKSEIGAYHAQYAKDTTGWVEWKPGGVAGKLMKVKPEYTRRLFVSRYMLPVRILSDAEVASMYKEYLSGTDIGVNWNVVTPGLRKELVKAGVKVTYDDIVKDTKKGTVTKFSEMFPDDTAEAERQKNNTATGDAMYSLRPNARSEVHAALYDKSKRDDIKLTESSPSILVGQKGVRNLPLLINVSHMRQNIFTEAEAKAQGYSVTDSDHYHGLGEDLFLDVIDDLDEVSIAYRGTKTADDPQRRENYFLLISSHEDNDGNTINVPIHINQTGQYNRVFMPSNKVATVFGRNGISQYIQEQVRKGNLVRVKNKGTKASERSALIADGYSNDSSGTTVTQPSDSVKLNSSRETSDFDSMSYAELQEEIRTNSMRYRDLTMKRQEAENSPAITSAMEEYAKLGDEMKDLFSKRHRGVATEAELKRIEEIKALRDDVIERVRVAQEESGLAAVTAELRENQERANALNEASAKAWAREGAAKEQAAIAKSGMSAAEYFRKKAVKAFHYTANFNEAGYMLPDGKLLNFSGGERNHRYRDHREIGEIYEATQGTQALNRFLADGNIRIMAESPGIDIASGVEPTAEQYAMLRKFINSHGVRDGEFYIDFSDKDGHRMGSYTYNGSVNTERVINDIKYFYQNGTTREQSSLAAFYYSDRDTSDFDVDWLDALDIDDLIKELEESLNSYTEKKQKAPRRVDEVKKQLRKIGLEFNGTKTAAWTDDHLKKVMEISSASNPKYAQAYVVYMKPIDYLNLTAGGNTNTMERIQNESADYGDLDMSKVGEIYLTIGDQKDSDGDGTARVYGHEGRHRMMLLGKAGFEKVPVMVFNSDNKYSKDYLWNLTLKPQKFGGEYFVSDTRSVTVTDAVPLSRDYESLAKAMYGSENESADVLYSERQQGELTDRELLANALESAAKNDAERQMLTEYKAEIERVNGLEDHLREVNAQIKELSFGKGKRDMAKLQKLKDDAAKTRNRIGIVDKRLLKMEAAAPLKNVLEAEKKKAQQRGAQHMREVNARYKDRTLRTQKRHQVWKTAQELERLLSKPTKGKYVPKELVTSVIEVMETLDLETGKNDKRNLQLSNLESIYKKMKGDSDYAIYHNEVIEKMLNELTQTIGDTSIMDMSIEQLDDIHTALKALKHTISEATKVRIGKEEHDAYEMSVKMTRETESARVMKNKLLRKWTLSMLRPQAAFERFGGYAKDNTWSRVFTLLNDGQLKQTRLTMEGQQIFAELLQDQKSLDKLISTKKGDLVDIGLKDRNGETVEITRGMMLSIYMHLQNEDNMRHFARGGVTVPDLKAYYGGKYKDAFGIGRHETAAVGENGVKDVLAKINGYMDDYDRAWVKAAQKFFDGFSKDTVNAATMEMYGFKKASVDKYFPIRTDPNYRAHNFESVSMDMSLENAGFMKDRVHASNPILLEDITDVVNSQINRVAQYAAIAPAIMQFNKVYSKVQTEFAGSIQSAVTSKFGAEGKQYIENVIADIQGARKADRNIFDELRGAQAAAVLTLSVRTTLAQAASYPSAAAIVGKKALAKAFLKGGKDGRMISRADKELIAKYSPLLWLRMQGYSSEEMGSIKDSKVDKVMKKMRWLTGWIQAMDGATVGRLWYAAEYYVQDNHSDLQQGTDAYYEEVAKVFNKIVEETQPDYTTMQRPDILRNPNALVKQLTMYMTQRLQNTNIMYDATQRAIRYQQDFKAGRNGVTAEDVHDARMKCFGAYASQMVAAATIVAFKGLADILMHSVNPYRDKDKELTEESVGLGLLNNFMDTLIGNVLWGSQIYDYAKKAILGEKYYGISMSGVEVVQDLLDYSNKFIQQPNMKNAEKLAMQISKFFGMPIENAKKIASAFYLHGKDIANGEFFSFEAGVERSKTIEEHRFTKAAVAGDKAKAESIDLTTSERQKGVQNSFEEGEITDAQAARILADYCDLSAPEAKNLVEFWKWKAKVGDAAKGWDVKAYTKYMEYGDSVGISLEMWNRHKAAVSGLSADKDENGKSISGSKKAKVLEAINSLPLTAKQKDSLYYAEGYSAKDIDEAPWH